MAGMVRRFPMVAVAVLAFLLRTCQAFMPVRYALPSHAPTSCPRGCRTGSSGSYGPPGRPPSKSSWRRHRGLQLSEESSPPASQEKPAVTLESLFSGDDRNVVLFDGMCNFCSDSVNFFMKYDQRKEGKGSFRFAAQESSIGASLLAEGTQKQFGSTAAPEDLKSIVVITPDGVFVKSDACLLIARDLAQPFPALGAVGGLVPTPILDIIYDFVSDKRFVFGEKDSCRIPEPEERERFLD